MLHRSLNTHKYHLKDQLKQTTIFAHEQQTDCILQAVISDVLFNFLKSPCT